MVAPLAQYGVRTVTIVKGQVIYESGLANLSFLAFAENSLDSVRRFVIVSASILSGTDWVWRFAGFRYRRRLFV